MAEFTGVVHRINTRQWQGKTFYSFALSGQDGWFNMGIRKPPTEGTTIAFEAKPNEKGYMEVDTKTIQRKADGTPQPANTALAASNGATGGYWDKKAERDIKNDQLRELGASRNTAIALIELMLKAEAIKLPTKQADKEAVIWEILDRYTQKLMKGETPEAPVGAPGNGPAEPVEKEEEEWA